MEDLGVKATNLASEASSAEASGSLQEAVNLHFQAAQAFLHASTYATDASLARQWKLASQDHATAGKKLNKKLAKASSKKKDSSKKKHNKGTFNFLLFYVTSHSLSKTLTFNFTTVVTKFEYALKKKQHALR